MPPVSGGGGRSARWSGAGLWCTIAGLVASLGLLIGACAPRLAPLGGEPTEPRLTGDRLVTGDGLELPLRAWLPGAGTAPWAVILALHGFNDYSGAFRDPGRFWAARGIATYAYDQRGFGAAPNRGLWAGAPALFADLTAAARALRARHPGLPLYLVGISMGGAVILGAIIGPDPPPGDGVILVAPAVLARSTMPILYRLALWLGAHTMPWLTVTGEGLEIQASDNIEMLRALGRDPLVIKATRIEAIHGLTDLMDLALGAAPRVDRPALVLYGEKDEVIPRNSTLRLWRGLPAPGVGRYRRALYPGGWHMLLRDLQAEVVLEDIVAWIEDRNAALPSGAEERATARLENLSE